MQNMFYFNFVEEYQINYTYARNSEQSFAVRGWWMNGEFEINNI